jgi:reverse transcriptase-like protein
VQIISDLGFAPEIVSWCKSFLKDRMVRLCFNGRTSNPFDFAVGTPQGLPVSPVLSIIYTAPLLQKMRSWSNTLLGMYINDGAIFACGKNWHDIKEAMRQGYITCMGWLKKAGLNAKPNKTELLFFKQCGNCSDPPPYIHLPLPSHNSYYQVPKLSTI